MKWANCGSDWWLLISENVENERQKGKNIQTQVLWLGEL